MQGTNRNLEGIPKLMQVTTLQLILGETCVQWKSRIKRYIDTKPNNELIHYCLQNTPYKFKWAEKTVPVVEGNSETTTEGYMENYKNVSQDIRDQLNAKAEAFQIILTGIDNDIYSTVDAYPNACEMWKAIERLKQGKSINVQDLETNYIGSLENSHHEMVNHLNRITQVLTSTTTVMAKLSTEQADWRDDTDDEPDDQELEAHYILAMFIQMSRGHSDAAMTILDHTLILSSFCRPLVSMKLIYMGYDPSDVAFTEWLMSKKFNYKTMDHYTKKTLWIYWIRGDDEVELTDEDFSDNEDEVVETYLLRTLKDSRLMKNIRMVGSMNGTETYHRLMRNHGLIVDWRNAGFCNGGNLPGAYIIRNSLHYQDYEWYEALMDRELKEQALRNKAIMEGLINDEESSNDGWKRWESHKISYHDHDELEYKNETHDERQELCEAHELLVCNIRRFEMIKCSFGQDEEYVVVREDEYDDFTNTSKEAIQAYQEIFRMMDEGWMVTRAE
ncbi:hypothetical protein Tco_0428414 [Tanacetum coccineum]